MNSNKGNLKCRRCSVCNGSGCIAQLPGLGGVFDNKNFQLNCSGWTNLCTAELKSQIEKIVFSPSQIMCGPVTGSVENIGYNNEEDFYFPYINGAHKLGFGVSLGDGCPDEKLKFGVAAAKKLFEENGVKSAFFLKPYPLEKLAERLSWISAYANYVGIDIDSYNILTMRNKVHLEKKTAQNLADFRKLTDLPFVIKGVFTQEDIQLVKESKPEVVYISNHGGRVETEVGSTAEFLKQNGKELKKYCKELWIDGGIRSKLDVQTALYYGADKVLIARPLIRAVFDEDTETLKNKFLG